MNNAEKIKLAEQILSLIGEAHEQEKPMLKFVGHLTKCQGINGFKKCDEGTPVFELNDRYIIVMETLDGKNCTQIPYYKETLSPSINFLTAIY